MTSYLITDPPAAPAGGLRINPALLADEPGTNGGLPTGVFLEGTEIPDDREHLFTLDGREYTTPRKVQPYLMFRFLRDTRRKGAMEAAAGLMEDLLTPAVMDILAEAETLTEDDAKAIFRIITKYMERNANRLMGN